jgi:hypothetical protein
MFSYWKNEFNMYESWLEGNTIAGGMWCDDMQFGRCGNVLEDPTVIVYSITSRKKAVIILERCNWPRRAQFWMMLGGDTGYKYFGNRTWHHILYSSVNPLISCTNLHRIGSRDCGDTYVHSFCKNELFLFAGYRSTVSFTLPRKSEQTASCRVVH